MIGYAVAGVIGAGRDRRDRRRVASRAAAAAAAATPTSTTRAARPTASSPTTAAGTEAAAGQGRQPEEGGEAGRLRPAPQPQEEGHDTHPAGQRRPRLQDQPADLGQPRRTALPAGRRRLQRNAARNRLRPLARARADGDPVQPRPRRKRPAGAEGPLRHDVRGDAALPQRKNALRRSRRPPGRNLLGCKKYKGAITLDAIRDFGKATWGIAGREPVEAFPFTGPTPRRTGQLASAAASAVGGKKPPASRPAESRS